MFKVSGVLSVDKLTWGGLVAPHQYFAEIDDAATFTISCVEDGLLGMAFDVIASSGKVTNSPLYLKTLLCFVLLLSSLFVFYMDKDFDHLLQN